MNDPARIKAVFFDLGGTLFHHLPQKFTSQNLRLTCHEFAFSPRSDSDIVNLYQRFRFNVEQEMLARPFFLHRELVATAFARTLEELGVTDPSAVSIFCDRQKEVVLNHLALRRDTLSTLERLRASGYCVAVVSNIDDEYIVPLLARSRLETKLDFWLSSEQAQSCKPDTSIFRQALTRAEVSPENVLFVGDSVPHDVHGAKRLGMATALLIADHPTGDVYAADFRISSIGETRQLLS